MTDPRTLSIKDFTYSLPEERIAQYPLAERDASKLLIYKDGNITEDIYRNIADHIPTRLIAVFNNTKVVEARLFFQKPTGGVIEIFCLEPHEQYPDITTAMLQQEKVLWHCLIGGASKWKHGQVLEKKIKHASKEFILHARYIEKATDSFVIEFSWNDPAYKFCRSVASCRSHSSSTLYKKRSRNNRCRKISNRLCSYMMDQLLHQLPVCILPKAFLKNLKKKIFKLILLHFMLAQGHLNL